MDRINIEDLKNGDMVELRCGGKLLVQTFNNTKFIGLYNSPENWASDGKHCPHLGSCDFDIIAIHKKPEPVVHGCWVNYYQNSGVFHIHWTLASAKSGMGLQGRIFKITVTDGIPAIEEQPQ